MNSTHLQISITLPAYTDTSSRFKRGLRVFINPQHLSGALIPRTPPTSAVFDYPLCHLPLLSPLFALAR